MVSDLIDAISVALNKEFGDGYRIYSEEVPQGAIEPCFLIKAVEPSQSQIRGPRYRRDTLFDIHFFPEHDYSYSEMNTVAERLFFLLEFIPLLNGDLVHGTHMRYETTDGVLHFFVQYNMIVRVVTEEDKMEEIKTETTLKG